jgi:peptidoglycan/xylan/chitin deacetylase (PgdA/CDA1 family)
MSAHTVALTIDDGWHAVYAFMFPLLQRHSMTATLGLVCGYIGNGDIRTTPHNGFMRAAEVDDMVENGRVEIASHSITHPFLNKLPAKQAWSEIAQSKATLERRFGRSVVSFIYPYGYANASVNAMVRDAGYRLGRSVGSRTLDLIHRPYMLPAFEIRRTTPLSQVTSHVLANKITILVLHQAVPFPRAYTQWDLAAFHKLLDWLRQNQVAVATLRQLSPRI